MGEDMHHQRDVQAAEISHSTHKSQLSRAPQTAQIPPITPKTPLLGLTLPLQPDLTPVDLADRLRSSAGEPFIFLDSSQQNGAESRYAIIAREPWFDCQVIAGQTIVNGQPADQTIWQVAQDFLHNHESDFTSLAKWPNQLPFCGGLLGYFSYDLAVLESNGLVPMPETYDLYSPQARLMAFDQMVIIDHVQNQIYLMAWGQHQPATQAMVALQTALATPYPSIKPHPPAHAYQHSIEGALRKNDPTMQSNWSKQSNFSKEKYCRQIEHIINAIEAGDVYILNMTQRFELQTPQDFWDTYCQLRAISPTPYATFFQAGGQHILSFSPEQFIQIRDRHVTTRPIKGTRPRGKNSAEDQKNREELQASLKDQAELLMIVDLERNDLSAVCEPDSVVVRDLFHLETFATVFHLVATVEGRLAEGQDAVSCIKACFPGGSITGAPKIRAMQLISEFEGLRRGLYTGCMGYFSLDGQTDFNILIRTILSDGQKTTYHAGGGITWDSDPQSEYQETLDKTKAIGGLFDVDR
ncbi:MAG: aminodeoxychorismate synthase component I [Eubacteriales bacterium]|nr:aminodeoxychorismate synthase component I [Eubacteriales bacterium]